MSFDLVQPPHQDSLPLKNHSITAARPSPPTTLHPWPAERLPSLLNNSSPHAQCTSASDSPSISSSSAKSSVTLSPSFAGERPGPISPGRTHLLAPDVEVHQRTPADPVGSRWTTINQFNIPSNSLEPDDAPVREHAGLPAPNPLIFHHHHSPPQPNTIQSGRPMEHNLPFSKDQPVPSKEIVGAASSMDSSWLSIVVDPDRDRATSTPPKLPGATSMPAASSAESPRMRKEKMKRRTFPPMGAHPARKPDPPTDHTIQPDAEPTTLALHTSPSCQFSQNARNLKLMSSPTETSTLRTVRGLSDSSSHQPRGIRNRLSSPSESHSCVVDGCKRQLDLGFDPKDAKWNPKGPVSAKESLRLQEELTLYSVRHRQQQEEAERKCAQGLRSDQPQHEPQVGSRNPPWSPSNESEAMSRGNKRKPEDTTPPLDEEPSAKNPRLEQSAQMTSTLADEGSQETTEDTEAHVFSEPMRILIGRGQTLYQQPHNDWRNMWRFPQHDQSRSRRNSHPPAPNRDARH